MIALPCARLEYQFAVDVNEDPHMHTVAFLEDERQGIFMSDVFDDLAHVFILTGELRCLLDHAFVPSPCYTNWVLISYSMQPLSRSVFKVKT